MKINFEIYENNGGGLCLFVLDAHGVAVAGYGNFELQPGSLSDAISAMEDDPEAYKDFGGDFGGDISMPPKYKFDCNT